jgi:hypothetical protein
VTSVDRTAYPGFARVVSARELAEAFTPTEAELEWARGRTQDENHLLALVVWLKSYQRLGYFPKVEDVPTVVVGHVRGALELGDDVELERAAVRSAKRHREFVRKRLGVVYDAARVRQIAEEAIRKTAQSVGGGLHHRRPAEEHLRHPARHHPCRYARTGAAGLRPRRAAGL